MHMSLLRATYDLLLHVADESVNILADNRSFVNSPLSIALRK